MDAIRTRLRGLNTGGNKRCLLARHPNSGQSTRGMSMEPCGEDDEGPFNATSSRLFVRAWDTAVRPRARRVLVLTGTGLAGPGDDVPLQGGSACCFLDPVNEQFLLLSSI